MLELCQNLITCIFIYLYLDQHKNLQIMGADLSKKLILKWHVRSRAYPCGCIQIVTESYINIFIYLVLLRNYHVKVGFQCVVQDYRTVSPIHMHVQSVQTSKRLDDKIERIMTKTDKNTILRTFLGLQNCRMKLTLLVCLLHLQLLIFVLLKIQKCHNLGEL